MQCANLTDDQLWRAISQNTEAMADLVQKMCKSNTASVAPTQTSRVANAQAIDALERQYRTYTAELRRRYP